MNFKNTLRLLSVLAITLMAQNNLEAQIYKTGEFEELEESPEPSFVEFPKFKGGKEGLKQFLIDEMKAQKDTSPNEKLEGVIVLVYKVNSKGKLTGIKVKKSESTVSRVFYKLIVQILKKSGPWEAGKFGEQTMGSKLSVSLEFD